MNEYTQWQYDIEKRILDLERAATSLDAMVADLIGVSLSVRPGQNVCKHGTRLTRYCTQCDKDNLRRMARNKQ